MVVVSGDRRRGQRALLLTLSMTELRLTGAEAPPLGHRVAIAITLPGRYIEFEVPGVIAWHHEGDFGVTLDHLTARQAYGIALAIELRRDAAAGPAPSTRWRKAL